MFLITTTSTTKPNDFIMVAQNPSTYELLGFSDTGVEYTGDFQGFQYRHSGRSNQLGISDLTDPMNPVLVTTNDSVTEQFNLAQDEFRAAAYKESVDKLLMESYRKSIDPKENGTSRGNSNAVAIAAVDVIKERYPKIL